MQANRTKQSNSYQLSTGFPIQNGGTRKNWGVLLSGLLALGLLLLAGCAAEGEDGLNERNYKPEDVTAIQIGVDTQEVAEADELQFKLVGTLTNGVLVDLTAHPRTVWTSTDEVAMGVGIAGMATAKVPGVVMVVATFQREDGNLSDVSEIRIAALAAPGAVVERRDRVSYELNGVFFEVVENEEDPWVTAALDITEQPFVTYIKAETGWQDDFWNPYADKLVLALRGDAADLYMHPGDDSASASAWLFSQSRGYYVTDWMPPYDAGVVINLDTFGAVGEPVEGRFAAALCHLDAADQETNGVGDECSTIPGSIASFSSGAFSVTRDPNLGTIANPKPVEEIEDAKALAVHSSEGGVNYHVVPVERPAWFQVDLTQMTAETDLVVFGGDETYTKPIVCAVDQTNVTGLDDEFCAVRVDSENLYFAVYYTGMGSGAQYSLDVQFYTPIPDLTVRINSVEGLTNPVRVYFTLGNHGLAPLPAGTSVPVQFYQNILQMGTLYVTLDAEIPPGGSEAYFTDWETNLAPGDTVQIEVDYDPALDRGFLTEMDEMNNFSSVYTVPSLP